MATPSKRAGSSSIACSSGLIDSHTVRHPVPSWRRIPFTEACSRRICSIAHRHARVVSDERGAAMPSSCSTNVATGHPGSGQTHRRLRQMIRTGRPIAGASTNATATRPWPCATTPQVGQPMTVGSDSTVTTSAPPSSRSTPITCSPSNPTNTSQRSQ